MECQPYVGTAQGDSPAPGPPSTKTTVTLTLSKTALSGNCGTGGESEVLFVGAVELEVAVVRAVKIVESEGWDEPEVSMCLSMTPIWLRCMQRYVWKSKLKLIIF